MLPMFQDKEYKRGILMHSGKSAVWASVTFIRYPLALQCSHPLGPAAVLRLGDRPALAPCSAAIPNAAAVCGRGGFCVSPPQGRPHAQAVFSHGRGSLLWAFAPVPFCSRRCRGKTTAQSLTVRKASQAAQATQQGEGLRHWGCPSHVPMPTPPMPNRPLPCMGSLFAVACLLPGCGIPVLFRQLERYAQLWAYLCSFHCDF